MKTGSSVELDFMHLILDSGIVVSGNAYYEGDRPRDSSLEDIVVKFISGLPAQIETGHVLISIYVPDIDANGNGQLLCNRTRCNAIERAFGDWVESISKHPNEIGYKVSLAQSIHTTREEEINQHFVAVRIKYKRFHNQH